MGKDYIPESDGAALGWMRAFAAHLSQQPGAYGMSLPDVTLVDDVVSAFGEAYDVTRAEKTRTVITTQEKSEARAAAERVIRRFAALIKANGGVSDVARLAAGLPLPHPARRKKLDAPGTSPLLDVLSATNERHHLTAVDSASPTRRAKPPGAVCLQVFVHVGDKPVSSWTDARFCVSVTTSRFSVTHEPEDSGKYATYFARWGSRRGEFGPWSTAKGMRIAA